MTSHFDSQPGGASHPKKSKLPVFIVLGSLILLAACVYCYWFFWARYEVKTTDAYVDGNIIEVFPRVEGTIKAIMVDDLDYVEEGQLLVALDDTDYQLQLEESKAQLGVVLRNTQQMFDQVNELVAALSQQLVYLEQAQAHFASREALVGIGGVSKENFEDSKITVLAAEAEILRLEEELKKAQAQTYNTTPLTHPQVQNAIERVRQSWLNLKYTQVCAPYSGYIAKKNAQVGETAGPTQTLLAIVPLDNLWITANLKERQLYNVRIGQSVRVKTDLYKQSVIFEGKVLGIAAGTGSVFSVLPPQNATGNWIKIVQRVPVRIGLKPKQIGQYPLRLGLSAEVTVNVYHSEGDVLTKLKPSQPISQTEIYNDPFVGVDKIIATIIGENLNLANENEI